MSLYQAMNTANAQTANGGVTNSTSLSHCVDLFGAIGASRGKDITTMFHRALAEDKNTAIRILLWARDVRGGAGERATFRQLVTELPFYEAEAVLRKIPELGRWDDLLVFLGTPLEPFALEMIHGALCRGDALCAKWMPRPNKPLCKQHKLWRKLGYRSPKEYRQHLAALTNVVETKMCENQWDSVEYSKLTSKNHLKYVGAFMRHDESRYRHYLGDVRKGDAKINAGVLYPHELASASRKGTKDNVEELWDNLPDFLESNGERILPMCDVSGSMTCGLNGGRPWERDSVNCMDASLGLSLYLAERLEGPFADLVLTFSERPKLLHVDRTMNLSHRINTLRRDVGYNTNIQRAFEVVLDKAVKHSLSDDELPNTIVIFSDMEFDDYQVRGNSVAALEGIKQGYEASGYTMPKLIFWNLNAREGNVPTQVNTPNTALVSGFSPALMKSVFGGDDFTPYGVMMRTIGNPRYNYA